MRVPDANGLRSAIALQVIEDFLAQIVAALNTVQNVQRSIIPFLFVRPQLDELGECGSSRAVFAHQGYGPHVANQAVICNGEVTHSMPRPLPGEDTLPLKSRTTKLSGAKL
jgi:hypothetical protein